MASANVSHRRNYFCVKNIAAIATTTMASCRSTTYWGDIYNNAVNPFEISAGNIFYPFRIIEIHNKSDNDILILINNQTDNIIYVPAHSTKTLGTEYKLFYNEWSVYTLGAIAANELVVEGRV